MQFLVLNFQIKCINISSYFTDFLIGLSTVEGLIIIIIFYLFILLLFKFTNILLFFIARFQLSTHILLVVGTGKFGSRPLK